MHYAHIQIFHTGHTQGTFNPTRSLQDGHFPFKDVTDA